MRWVVVAALTGWVGVSLSCGTARQCGPENCSGCCDAQGTCRAGTEVDSCGKKGAGCAACTAAQACVDKECRGGPADAGTELEKFCLDYAQAYCDARLACRTVEASERDTCVAHNTAANCVRVGSVVRGYAAFDAAKAARCLSELTASAPSCRLNLGSCSGLLSARAGVGQSCLFHSDCASPTAACFGAGCARACTEGGNLGEPCRGSCSGANLWCDGKSATCARQLTLGSACTSDSFSSPQCEAGTFCDLAVGQCRVLPGPGQPCRTGSVSACLSTAWCDYSASPYLCRAITPTGQPCANQQQCGTGSFCDSNGSTCQPQKGQGQSCTASNGCQSGLFCSGSVCLPRLVEGLVCRSSLDCALELGCDSVQRRCAPYQSVSIGSACTGSTRYCSSGAVCVGAVTNADGGIGSEGICTVLQLGDSCRYHFECPAEAFCNGSQKCQTAQVGTSCEASRQCLSGQFCALNRACAQQLGSGSPCNVFDACQVPLACRYTATGADAGVCGELGVANAPCVGSGQCKFPYECVGNRCVRSSGPGEVCYQGLYCIQGGCHRADGGTQCGAKLADQARCSSSLDCVSGRCDLGYCQRTCP